MIVTKTMGRAQQLLLVLMLYIAQSDSHWFTINGETSRDISLCQCLGFHDAINYYAFLVTAGLAGYDINKSTQKKELKIRPRMWQHMLNSVPNQAELFDLNQKKMMLKMQSKERHKFLPIDSVTASSVLE